MSKYTFRQILQEEVDLDDVGNFDPEDSFEDWDKEELEDLLVDFIIEIDDDEVPERLEEFYYYLMEQIEDMYEEEDDEDDELGESLPRKRKRFSISDRLKRRKDYRKNKAKIKRKQKLRRQKPSFKRYKKKAKRMAKRGRTATGKRQITKIN